MSTIFHTHQPIHEVPRISTRILVHETARQTALWEQWIQPGGFIPLHYHKVEELLVLLSGEVEAQFRVGLGDQQQLIASPATIVVPPKLVHGLRHHGETTVHLLAFFPVPSPEIFSPEGDLRPLPWEDWQSVADQ